MPQPPYSPDLSPTDYQLFRFPNNYLRQKYFHNQQSLELELQQFFTRKDESFFMDGIKLVVTENINE